MKKLRIAMYFSSDPSSYGGVQQCTYYLSKALERRGHSVTVFGPSTSRLPFSSYRLIGEVVRIPWPNGNWVNFTTAKKIRENIARLFNPKEFDICHIHEPYIPFVAWNLMRFVSIPKVTSFHTAWDTSSILSMANSFIPVFQQYFSANADGAIFSTQLVRKLWQPLCDSSVIQTTIPFGIDKDLYMPRFEKKQPYTMLFVARFVKKKGLRYILNVMPSLIKKHPGLRLIVVGDGPERSSYERLVAALRLSKRVIFKGAVSEAEKIRLYQQADLFLAPYVDEGFGITVLEAIATGCPIVGFQNDAFAEVLRGYPVSKLIVRPKKSRELEAAISFYYKSRNLQMKLRDWCLAERDKYSWDNVAIQTEKFYFHVRSGTSFEKRPEHVSRLVSRAFV